VSAASLIGFGAVFLLVCSASSAALAAGLHAGQRALARRGAAALRRVAELAAVLPVALAAAVVAVLAIESATAADHCATHGDHAHLCLRHGAAWAEHAWAIAAVAGAAAVLAVRAAGLAIVLLRGRAAVARLRALGGEAPGPGPRVRLVESERVFCFAAGLRRPEIFASTGARAALDPDEWRAMLAHEASHLAHKDLLHRLGLELLLLLAAPLAGPAIRARWGAATEQLRDADAADELGDPEPVASALVQMARHAAALPLGGAAAFTPGGAALLAARVEALLDRAPRGERAARHIGRAALAATAAAVAAALAFAGPLHHALETLLG
jgi:Zn-dependent protease with chaperone function